MQKKDILKSLAYIYILAPLAIFLLGWTKLYLVGIPLTIGIVISLYSMIGSTKTQLVSTTKIDVLKIIVIVLIISAWVLVSGVGGFFWQNEDHYWRNEIFEILVNYKWPVVVGTSSGTKGLSYYVGFWMVPAVVGKLFGVDSGYFAQLIWAIVGVTLAYLLVCRRFKRVLIWPLIVFIFFSGLDIVGQIVFNQGNFVEYAIGDHIENWISGYQYSSMTTQLFWVFNQAIYAWIITAIILEETNAGVVLIMAAGIFSSTLPMVGLAPIVLVVIYNNIMRKKKYSGKRFLKVFFESCITYENMIGGLCGIVLIMLFIGNGAIAYSPELIYKLIGIAIFILIFACIIYYFIKIKGFKINLENIKNKIHDNTKIKVASYVGLVTIIVVLGYLINFISGSGNEKTQDNNLFTYIIFLLIEIGLYVLFTIKEGRNNKIYVCSLIVLLGCPLITIGTSIDFCMRASIPGLFVLYIAVIECMSDAFEKKNTKKMVFIVGTLLVGMITPTEEFIRTAINQSEYVESGKLSVGSNSILEGINFSSYTDNNLFYEYIAK
ncbi:hypothetical protein [Pseudobutyrivibrio ruminis]|uniref:hypothetical protein n=1 Tax=Pseudobutyrivibrio ruminis TaxID=46206 RepID=UPI00051B1691|nr:hypothetical protein [Pseudobutyrivibrio ruminis]